MKKVLYFGVLFMLLVALASSCNIEAKRHDKEILKLQKNINSALSENDFKAAHLHLGELLQIYDRWDLDAVESSVRDVYLSEMRYLVSQNDVPSWNRAYMLPMEVPYFDKSNENRTGKLITKLYRTLYDYAVEFENKEIEEKTGKKLGIIKDEKMIVPVSTSIAGPNGNYFALVVNEAGNKLVMDEESWTLTVEIKRVKKGKVVEVDKCKDGSRSYVERYFRLYLSLLDEDNDSICDSFAKGWDDIAELSVGESVYLTFSGRNTGNVKNAAKFDVYSK